MEPINNLPFNYQTPKEKLNNKFNKGTYTNPFLENIGIIIHPGVTTPVSVLIHNTQNNISSGLSDQRKAYLNSVKKELFTEESEIGLDLENKKVSKKVANSQILETQEILYWYHKIRFLKADKHHSIKPKKIVGNLCSPDEYKSLKPNTTNEKKVNVFKLLISKFEKK